MLYLGNRKTQDNLIEMLRIIFKEKAPALVKKRQLEEEYGIHLTEDETKELKKMCNLSEGVYNSGFNDGVNVGTLNKAKDSVRKFQRHLVLEALITRFIRAHKIPSASAGGIFFMYPL